MNPLENQDVQAGLIAEVHQGNYAVAAAQAAVSQIGLIPGITKSPYSGPVASTKITLIATGYAAGGAIAVANTSAFGAPGLTNIGAVGSSATTTLASLTFDIAPSTLGGLAQSISESYDARETLHQTANGFYVDQFGVGAGSFSMSAIVTFQNASTVQQQVKAFTDILRLSKGQGTPFNPNPSPTVIYLNTINGRKLQLTIKNVTFSESANDPHLGKVSITADILFDYAYAPSATAPAKLVSTNPPVSTTTALTAFGTAIITQAANGLFGI